MNPSSAGSNNASVSPAKQVPALKNEDIRESIDAANEDKVSYESHHEPSKPSGTFLTNPEPADEEQAQEVLEVDNIDEDIAAPQEE